MAIFKLPNKSGKIYSDNVSDRTKMIEAEAMADLAYAFPMMVCGDVQSMRLAMNEARGLYEPNRTQHIQSRLLPIAQRLKGQGTVFGYPLVTDVATHLYNFIDRHKSYNKVELDTIYNDILMLQNILWKRISGDGGKTGQEILSQLI